MLSPNDALNLSLRRFKPSFEAVGIVADYVSRVSPFDTFAAGPLLTTLKYQILNGYHVAGFRDETLIGYCGWLQVARREAELWLKEQGELKPAQPERADAVALHIVRIDHPGAVLPLIRACRKSEPGKRVFFKRDYMGQAGATRRSSVMNVSI
jgi:hypothetical protein